MAKKKTFKVTIDVSTEVELTILASSAAKAKDIAQDVANNLVLDNSAYNDDAITDVTDYLDCDVNEPEEKDDE